jgi:hypothetical protein
MSTQPMAIGTELCGQLPLFLVGEMPQKPSGPRRYQPWLTAEVNRKGVLDIDTVKGCELGMRAYPHGGCYGECYAARTAALYGFDFTVSVSRRTWCDLWHLATIYKIMNTVSAAWYRIGTAGDPCHDWKNTLAVCWALRHSGKVPVIITKHWIELSDEQLEKLARLSAVVNTSTSGLDTDEETAHRVNQLDRLRRAGIRSINRVVTCSYGTSEWARERRERQDYLLSFVPVIDNPLRPRRSNPRVISGDILTTCRNDSVGGGKLVSLHSGSVFLGTCNNCPDQCGVDVSTSSSRKGIGDHMTPIQGELFPSAVKFIHVESVIGSGFEQDVAALALEDGIAHRAARKNMQIHSAIILLINDKFAGFMTFQINHVCKEFCLLQSVIHPDHYTDDLYRQMVLKVIEQNTYGYPAIMTTNPKSKFETPKLFESLGFQTYLAMSGFCYMVHGDLKDVRMKLLAHITMTNVWEPNRAEWLKAKREWNRQIEEAGAKHSVLNPTYASREGCWQGEAGFANVVTGHSHNGNASVLDPVACEVILRFFMPAEGRRVYNPFGGGVQFGFVTGASGFEYVASEIRKNQCDANNAICSDFPAVEWVQADSSVYEPEKMFDLIFSCPPYYRVERYVDYDGQAPVGEINSLPTYEAFRDTLFAGYRVAIKHLNDGCFFVVMTGDSRGKDGGYNSHEAETELFLRSQGLIIYNRIVYLESEFTRLAQAKKTLNTRKFPKREQKIIVAYKGRADEIKDRFAQVGRL